MEVREAKALELADRGRVVRDGDGWLVFSLTSIDRYRVTLSPVFCDCPDFELRQQDCKHVSACRIVQSREQAGIRPEPDAAIVPPFPWPRKSYAQDWSKYDGAQQNEKHEFQRLLADLCGTVPDRPGNPMGGEPFAPLGDVLFATTFKIYTGFSGRRFATDLRDAEERGHVSRAVHHSTVARCLENAATTPILTRLIEQSALPFAAIEDEFAVDSSGFSGCRFDRWYSVKWGRMESEHSWKKAHILCGTTTHTIAAVVITDKDAHDSPQFPGLVGTAAKHFKIRQIAGDKAYTAGENFQVADDAGGRLYAPFKVNATGRAGGIFERMYHLFCLNRDKYLDHYHRRSNVESVFSAVKRLFADSVRSKTDTAMMNEVLGKLLAYNLCRLVHAIFELGLNVELGDKPKAPAILKFPGAG